MIQYTKATLINARHRYRSMIDELYTVDTPEQIEVAYDVAGPGSRALAALLDHLLVLLLVIVIALLLAALTTVVGINSGILALVAATFGSYFLLCAYYIAFETWWNGQTPGKRALNLRMVQIDGRPIGFAASTIRNLLRIADFLPGAYGLGFTVMFFDKRSRRLGDIAAGAMAVRQRDALTLERLADQIAMPPAPVDAAPQVTIPNMEALRPSDVDLVDTFVRRRPTLTADARTRVAHQVLTHVQARLGYPVHGDPEAFLVQLAAEYQTLQRQRRGG